MAYYRFCSPRQAFYLGLVIFSVGLRTAANFYQISSLICAVRTAHQHLRCRCAHPNAVRRDQPAKSTAKISADSSGAIVRAPSMRVRSQPPAASPPAAENRFPASRKPVQRRACSGTPLRLRYGSTLASSCGSPAAPNGQLSPQQLEQPRPSSPL